jgi:hypothetical protein
VLVRFYAVDVEDPAREILRRAQNSMNCEGGREEN